MIKAKFLTTVAVFSVAVVTNVYGAASDLSCKNIDVSTFYGAYIDDTNAQKYVSFNGASILDITPPATSADKKVAKIITLNFEGLPTIGAPYTNFAFKPVKSTNTNLGASKLASLGTVPITTYYAAYTDSNNVQKYVSFNGASILDITPPATSADKKVAKIITASFSAKPTIGTGNCQYEVSLDGFYLQSNGIFQQDDDGNAITCTPKVQLMFNALSGGSCNQGTTDTTPPAIPTLGAITSTSLVVTAENGSTIKIYSGTSATGTPISTVTANGQAQTLTFPALASGTTVTVTATDTAGNVSTVSSAAQKTYTEVDTTPPAIPTLGAITSTSLVVTAENGSTIKIYSGTSATGTPISTVTANGQAQTLTFPALASGTTVTVTATDTASNVSIVSSAAQKTYTAASTGGIDTPPQVPGTTTNTDLLPPSTPSI